MKKELLLMRHGKSDWRVHASDFDRPLMKRGRKAALSMGGWLLQNQMVPDYVISSPAKRAFSTAEIICNATGLDDASICQDEKIYEATLEDLLHVLARLPPDTKRVLLIGHNPGLEELLKYLVEDIMALGDSKLLPTAAIAYLRINKDWSRIREQHAELISIVRPRELALLSARGSVFQQGVYKAEIDPRDYNSQLQFCLYPELRTDAAIKGVLLSLLDMMEANEEGLINDADAEHLHDFRVAVRRSRSVLSQVKGVFPKKILHRFVRDLKWLGFVTGPVRDLQVYLQKFGSYQQALPVEIRHHLDSLQVFLAEQKAVEQNKITKRLLGSRYKNFKVDWRDYLQAPVPRRTALPHAKRAVIKTSDVYIWKAHKRVLKLGKAIAPECPDKQLHCLRIACKKLRYLLEFFQGLYPAQDMRRLIKSLKQLQDILGDFNDFSVQIGFMPHLEQQMEQKGVFSRDTHKAMEILEEYFREQMHRQRVLFNDSFLQFSDMENRVLFTQLCKPPATKK